MNWRVQSQLEFRANMRPRPPGTENWRKKSKGTRRPKQLSQVVVVFIYRWRDLSATKLYKARWITSARSALHECAADRRVLWPFDERLVGGKRKKKQSKNRTTCAHMQTYANVSLCKRWGESQVATRKRERKRRLSERPDLEGLIVLAVSV